MAQRLIGIRVEKRVIRLPAGFVLEDPSCTDNPNDCCPCCDPPPADTLYAELIDATGGCSCPPSCVVLVYNVLSDAWYSGNLAPHCGLVTNLFLRLKCLVGVWAFDLVDATDGTETVQITGTVTDNGCDPFSVTGVFSDSAPILCGTPGTFTYSLSTTDCRPAGITNGCCDNVQQTLYATFSGALSSLGSIPLTYNSGTASWAGLGTGCGIGTIRLECSEPSNVWVLSLGPAASATSTAETSCTPFLLTMTGTGSTCSGSFTVVITE